MTDQPPIVLYDGHCHLCNGAVAFILRRDSRKLFRFAALQSSAGQRILRESGRASDELSSIVLIENGVIYDRSTAALRISRRMSGLWPLCYGAMILPQGWRDGIYQWIARNRYRWFGQSDSCMPPPADERDRFLED